MKILPLALLCFVGASLCGATESISESIVRSLKKMSGSSLLAGTINR